MRILTAAVLSCLSATAAAGDVYRWVDGNGVVHYSDKPQAPSDKPAALPQLQTFKPGNPPSGFATPPPAAAKNGATAAADAIAIVSPAPDETIRDADGKFTVSVNVNLREGEGLVYYLDGNAVNAQPTPSTAFLYSGVDRGEHSVTVAMVGADGHEVARAATVTIHMKPPMAQRHGG
ncbi:MAG: DUF4124 domain-containing protein [Nevskia sp.]|nr:DUF4124 domain-containing protein [Nevskia sp.]